MRNITGTRSIIPNNYYFTFDKIYNNEAEIQIDDGVLIGRCVLALDTRKVYMKIARNNEFDYLEVAKLDNSGRLNTLEGVYWNDTNFNSIDQITNKDTFNGDGVYILYYGNTSGTFPETTEFSFESGDMFILEQHSEVINDSGETPTVTIYQTLFELDDTNKDDDTNGMNINHKHKSWFRKIVYNINSFSGTDANLNIYNKIATTGGTKLVYAGKSSAGLSDSSYYTISMSNTPSWFDLSEQYIGYLGGLNPITYNGKSNGNVSGGQNLVEVINKLDEIVGCYGRLKDTDTVVDDNTKANALVNSGNKRPYVFDLSNSNTTIIDSLIELAARVGNLTNNSNIDYVKNGKDQANKAYSLDDAISYMNNAIIGTFGDFQNFENSANGSITAVVKNIDGKIGKISDLVGNGMGNETNLIPKLAELNETLGEISELNQEYFGGGSSGSLVNKLINLHSKITSLDADKNQIINLINNLSENVDILEIMLNDFVSKYSAESKSSLVWQEL